ncbi:hypothetical protein A2U01_0086168, partial [Trifolium medium]|nr:hypothetical protein [Trifolium medium]
FGIWRWWRSVLVSSFSGVVQPWVVVRFWRLGVFPAAFFAPVAVGVRDRGRSEGGFYACSGLFAESCVFFCSGGWRGVLELAM